MNKRYFIAVLLCGLAVASISAQEAGPLPSPAYEPLAPDELDELLGAIALYPDVLISEILPAATFPTQIVMADRYVTNGSDPITLDQQPWDSSVQALAHYPTLLQWLDDNLQWTTTLGDVFMNQQEDVLDSIQRLRRDAYNMGNLQSTAQLQVVDDGTNIEILPVDDTDVSLPEYQPDYTCYRTAFPVVWKTAVRMGHWLDCEFDWDSRRIVFWDHNHPRPEGWWHESPDDRGAFLTGHTAVWKHQEVASVKPANGADRGWKNQSQAPKSAPPARTVIGVPWLLSQQAAPDYRSTPAREIHKGFGEQMRPQGSPVEHHGMSQPTSDGAFIGIQSSHDTKTYSDRGQESLGTVARSGPVLRPAPAPAPASPRASSMGVGRADKR